MDPDAASIDRVIQMLHGENNLFWHDRIKRIFAAVGIATRRIEQEEAHPVWLLRDGGIKIVRDEFNIINRCGDRLRCVFLLDLGALGAA